MIIKERWLFSPSVRRFERGEIASCEFAQSFITEWGLRLTPQAFVKEFASWPREFFPGAREIIRDLRTTYRVGCLSNSNALHWERFGGFEEDFDITLFSHLLGAVKPDCEIFLLALRECGVEPSEVYFFDDCCANVRTAQSLGITAFHVDGFKSLQDVLRIQGLLSDSVCQI
jgi:glucose-1-phosphatase